MAHRIGEIRVCRDCSQGFEHFGAKGSRCQPCLKASKLACYERDKKNPKWVERTRAIARAKYLRNKQLIQAILKQCRCRDCRESDPRTLAFYDQQGKYLPVSNKIRRGSVETIKEYANQCLVLCFNCRAKLPMSRIHISMKAA